MKQKQGKRKPRTAKLGNLIDPVADILETTRGKARLILDGMAVAMAAAIKRDEKIYLDGFGLLIPHHQRERFYAHPKPRRSWDPLEVRPARRFIRFIPYPALIKILNENYQGLDTLEELYETKETRSNPRNP